MSSLLNNEKILVCVYYGPNGERLIRRGGELARLLQCPLFVLSVIPLREDELDQAQERYMAEWKMKCDEYGATFIVKTNEDRKASEIIAETAKNHHITQLIIGQSGQTRWQEITRGSFINELLNQIGETDLHIVAVQRMDEQMADTHERGIRVTVFRDGSQYMLENKESGGDPIAEGLFFKELNTDFDTGLLKIKTGREVQYLKISHGNVVDSSFFQNREMYEKHSDQ
ncbi:universal stress protein [Paenibacillus lautus]|uniref:universal stress protein n=1 Tax=Paenibacillus lautus TaxID=1401 RepID=UPI002DB67B1F|nr:universal stress protein [Paenibacillus lautus]MEC0310817.1 universal stress protein [Paenibacillus lautus]